ncbi:unnamed protein product [Musa acuminata subsp. burmannicoides]
MFRFLVSNSGCILGISFFPTSQNRDQIGQIVDLSVCVYVCNVY